jgi:hypothetical protein
MKADNVLQDAPGVPFAARRLGVPVLTDDFDLVGKGLTDTEVTVGNVVGSVRHVNLLRHHYPILGPEALEHLRPPGPQRLWTEHQMDDQLSSPRR